MIEMLIGEIDYINMLQAFYLLKINSNVGFNEIDKSTQKPKKML